MWMALLLFISGVLTDLIWALYIRHVSVNNRVRAALYSVGTGLATIVLIEGVKENVWLAPFWLIGLYLGTYYSQTIETKAGKIYEQIVSRFTGR